jgi:CRP/FNR family transcriptional regulator, cyclic AMP receptor protein
MSSCDQMLIIRENQLFSQLSEEEYEEIGLVHHFKEAEPNEFIYFERYLNSRLFFLKDGYIKIGYHDKEGNEVIKEIIGRGDVFGRFSLQPGNREAEFAQAFKTKVSLCAFTLTDFEQLLHKKPNLAIRFYKQMGEKLTQIENRMINLLQKDVRSRLLFFLHSFVRQHPQFAINNSFNMPALLTHEDIAKLIASSRQTVTTTLNELQKEGLLNFSRNGLMVPDIKKLQKIATVG